MVANTLLRNDHEALRQIAEEVAKGLSYARAVGSEIFVQTPVASPFGRGIGVKILGGPSTFTITDDGFAMREAEMMGAEDICRREARKIAAEYDLRFSDWELFEVDAPQEKLVGLTALLANAVARTLARTRKKFAERFETRRKEDLADRLSRIFGERCVSRDVEFNGAAKVWNFDALVDLPSGRPGLFSVVFPSPTSIAFAYSKLDDVSRVERPPFLAAVVVGTMDPADKALLSRPARKLYSTTDPDEEFRRAA